MNRVVAEHRIPNPLADKLKCIVCDRVLSHLPVYTYETGGSVCGRCPKPSASVIRNVIFENLIKNLKFQCINDGCTEYVNPDNVPKHEKYCLFQKPKCPVESCRWIGMTYELYEHYDIVHPTFLMTNETKFEVNFVQAHNVNYLLASGENLFVVNRKTDSEAEEFSIGIKYIGGNASVEDYSYLIHFQDGGKAEHFTVKKTNLAEELIVSLDFLKASLGNPTTIIAELNIYQIQDDENEVSVAGNSEINSELLSGLECPVCFEYMVPPIIQCPTGHSMCEKCKNNSAACFICKAEFTNTRNYALENMTNAVSYPCKNEECNFMAKVTEINNHQKFCSFGSFNCPLSEYTTCDFKSTLGKLLKHIDRNHPENLLLVQTVHVPFAKEKPFEDCLIMVYNKQLFQMHYKYADEKFYWAVQLIGSPEKCSKYKFEVDIIDGSGRNLRAYQKGFCGRLCDKEHCFEDGQKFITFNFQQIKELISNDFSYLIRVIHE